eukprot:403345487
MYRLGIDEQKFVGIRGAAAASSQVDQIDLIPKPLFLFIIMPDFLFIIAFLLLFWQLLYLYNQGHANLFKVMCQGRGKILILITITILSTLQSTMLLLYLFGAVSAKAFSIECTILNFVAATFVWIILLIYALMFSGSPFRSNAYKLKMRKLTLAIVIWCACRYFRGITGAFETRCYRFVMKSMTSEKNDSLALPILSILVFVIQEIAPLLYILDWSFMEIFVICGEQNAIRKFMGANYVYDGMNGYEYQEQMSLNFNHNHNALQESYRNSPALKNQLLSRNHYSISSNDQGSGTGGIGSKNDSLSSLTNTNSRIKQLSGFKRYQLQLDGMVSRVKRQINLDINNQNPSNIEDFSAENRDCEINNHGSINLIQNDNMSSAGIEMMNQPSMNYNQQFINADSQDLIDLQQIFSIIIERKDFQIEKLFDQKNRGLGKLYEARLYNKEVLCREIQFKRIKEYVVEDFIKEMICQQNTGLREVLPILGVNFDPKQMALYVLMPREQPLYKFIHQQENNRKIQPDLKKHIAIKIAYAMMKIQQKQKDPRIDIDQNYYSHKHLSSFNIMLNGKEESFLQSLNVLISDMDSELLKKYAKLFMNYQNLNAWSPPELFLQDPYFKSTNTSMQSAQDQIQLTPQQTPSTGQNQQLQLSPILIQNDPRSIDVYSFGVILWELETQLVPFEGMEISEVKNLVVDQSLRPQILQTTDQNLAYLIRCCWQKKADKRPTFEFIHNFLDKVQFS